MIFNLTHARHDPAFCLAPQLFRSLAPGDRKRLKLDVVYIYGEDRIEFSGPEPLGSDDLRVLQGLIAMAAVSGESGRGIMLSHATESDAGRQLRQALDLRGEAVSKDVMVAQCSYKHLAREIGYAESGKNIKAIKACVERLWKVSVIVQHGTKRQGFRILSEYASDSSSDGRLFVALNHRIAEAITGKRGYAYINMDEVRAIKADPCRFIHQRLSGQIAPGQSQRVGLATLALYAWPDTAHHEAMKKRYQRTRKALDELRALGWTVDEYAKSKFLIARPSGNALPAAGNY